jgi:hypothetical protein
MTSLQWLAFKDELSCWLSFLDFLASGALSSREF